MFKRIYAYLKHWLTGKHTVEYINSHGMKCIVCYKTKQKCREEQL